MCVCFTNSVSHIYSCQEVQGGGSVWKWYSMGDMGKISQVISSNFKQYLGFIGLTSLSIFWSSQANFASQEEDGSNEEENNDAKSRYVHSYYLTQTLFCDKKLSRSKNWSTLLYSSPPVVTWDHGFGCGSWQGKAQSIRSRTAHLFDNPEMSDISILSVDENWWFGNTVKDFSVSTH